MVFCAFCAVTPVSEDVDGTATLNVGTDSTKSVTVMNETELREAVASNSIYTKVILGANITVTGTSIEVLKDGIVIDGAGYKITAMKGSSDNKFTGNWISNAQGTIYVLNIWYNATVSNLDIDCAGIACGGINVGGVNEAKTVTLSDVDVVDYYGAGFNLTKKKTVKMDECSASTYVEIKRSDDSNKNWGGVAVDQSVNLTIDSLNNVGYVYTDDANSTVTVKDGKVDIQATGATAKAYSTSAYSAHVSASVSKFITIALGTNAYFDATAGTTLSSVKITSDSGKNSVTLKNVTAGKDGLRFAQGSVEISGTIPAGQDVEINATSGEIKLDGMTVTPSEVEGQGLNITISGTDAVVKITGKLTVPEKSSLTITDGDQLVIDPKATLAVGGTVTGSIENNGTIAITSTIADIPDSIGGTGTVDTSAVASEGVLGLSLIHI